MPIKNDREYRNTGAFDQILRAEDNNGNYLVTGYASTFEPYLLFVDDGVEYWEQIAPTAFDDSDVSDVVFLLDHTGKVYARTKNDSLRLNVDDHGLNTLTNLGLTASSREVYEDIRAGNYSQMSFSFVVAPGGDHFIDERGKVTRVIDRIGKLFDVSAVAFPANPGTDIGVSYRDLFNGVIEAREAERLKAMKERALLKLKLYRERAKDGNS